MSRIVVKVSFFPSSSQSPFCHRQPPWMSSCTQLPTPFSSPCHLTFHSASLLKPFSSSSVTSPAKCNRPWFSFNPTPVITHSGQWLLTLLKTFGLYNTAHSSFPSSLFINPLSACDTHQCPTLASCSSHPLPDWALYSLISLKLKLAQSCPTLCDSMDYTVHGFLQARILEWLVFPFFRGSSQPRDRTQVSCIAGRFFTSWTTREAH